MSDEWRVSLVLGDRTGAPKKLVEDLRVRLGDDVGVSADKAHIHLYAGTGKAAGEAEQVAPRRWRWTAGSRNRRCSSAGTRTARSGGIRGSRYRMTISSRPSGPAGPNCSTASSRS